MFTTGEYYMPPPPEMDISSYSRLSCNYPSPPSNLNSPGPVLLNIPENVNESLWRGSPIPVSPGGANSVHNETLC